MYIHEKMLDGDQWTTSHHLIKQSTGEKIRLEQQVHLETRFEIKTLCWNDEGVIQLVF